MKEHHIPNVEIIFYSFIFGFGFILIGLLITNNFFSSLQFWNQVRIIHFCSFNLETKTNKKKKKENE